MRHSSLVHLVTYAILGVTASQRVDTHIHALLPAYVAAVAAAGGDPSGYPEPDWTVDATLTSMTSIGTEIGILSVSSPGVGIAGIGAEAPTLARGLNEYLGNLTTSDEYESRLGFFGVLPDWQDINGTVAEIDYLYKEQKLCSGVTVFTTYGQRLLGSPAFQPIWAKLQSYKALVFLHPSLLDVDPRFIGAGIPQPIVDYPLATTRTAVDLVMTGTVDRTPDVDIILSHAGGALPFLAERAAGSLVIPDIAADASANAAQALVDFKRFYFDTALSTSTAQLDGLLDLADPSHILFGSDFPYAPQPAIDVLLAEYSAYVTTNSRGSKIAPGILRSNSINLLNKHSQGRVFLDARIRTKSFV